MRMTRYAFNFSVMFYCRNEKCLDAEIFTLAQPAGKKNEPTTAHA